MALIFQRVTLEHPTVQKKLSEQFVCAWIDSGGFSNSPVDASKNRSRCLDVFPDGYGHGQIVGFFCMPDKRIVDAFSGHHTPKTTVEMIDRVLRFTASGDKLKSSPGKPYRGENVEPYALKILDLPFPTEGTP